MSNYPPPGMQPGYPQPGYPVQPQPSGCGCGGCLGKFFALLGVAFFLMVVVCCGGGYFFLQSIKNSVTQQPAEVVAISDEIATMSVPAPLQPMGGGRFKLPIANTPLGQGAFYQSPNKKAVVAVASFTEALGPQFREKLVTSLESGPNQNTANDDDLHEDFKHDDPKDLKTSDIERTINGEKATFHITEGVGARTGKKKLRVEGKFNGKLGPAMLVVIAEEETLSREKVDELIKSIGEGEPAGK